jgi:S-layer homology domain
MPHPIWRTASILVASIVLVSVGLAQELRVADPDQARAAGLTGSAPVYALTKGSDEAQLDEKAYGTATTTSAIIQGNMFQPRISTGAYNTSFGQGDMTFVSGDTFFDYRIDLPTGAILKEVDWWGNDADATNDLGLIILSSCNNPSSSGTPVATVIANVPTATSAGNFYQAVSANNTVIDNHTCAYFARVRFDAVGMRLDRARIVWQRQVSPAPLIATFNDVSTVHPFFRFVEALAAAGITGGCGGGNYCPDSPVTRGQMAVFLSVALGLHFPN